MSAATATQPAVRPSVPPPEAPPKRISWADFQRKYLSREDGYKYEWVEGNIEKTRRTMHQLQLLILRNLRLYFNSLYAAGKTTGSFESEIDAFFLPKIHRRPDVSFYDYRQLLNIANGQQEVPEFVIEIISTNDQVNRLVKKMQNYRDAGVRVVWQIYPEAREIHVYSSEGLMEMTVCKGQRICSAAPVLPDFQLSADAVFQLPEGA